MTDPFVTAPFISQKVEDGQYYFLDLDGQGEESLKVVCGGSEQCLPDYVVDRDDFAYHSIEYVSAGQGLLSLNGNQFPLRPGAIFYYGPGISHRIETTSNKPMLKTFVDFSGSQVNDLLRGNPLLQLEPLQVSDPLRIYEIFQNLAYSGSTGSNYSARICSVLLELLVLRIAESTVSYRQAGSQAWETYQQVRRRIDERYMDIQSLNELAQQVHLDSAYLCRLFRRFSQESPYQLLVRRKMQRAAQRLVQSNMLIKQVAKEVGFDDPYHFSKVFKKVHGLAPDAFARTSRRGNRPIKP